MKKSNYKYLLVVIAIITIGVTKTFSSTKMPTDIKGWLLSGSNTKDYEIGTSKESTNGGGSSGYLRSLKTNVKGFGTLMQIASANPYLGKRVRMTAYIKTKDVKKAAGMWMRVDKKVERQGKEDFVTTAFDNMQNMGIKGSTDWQKYAIVLDVEEKSSQIAFGLLLDGSGEAWITDIKFEIVNQGVPTTDIINEYILTGSNPEQYKTGRAKELFRSDTIETRYLQFLKNTNKNAKGFGTITKTLETESYLGKRIKMSALVKTKDIEGWAGLWMRIDENRNGKENTLSFDNMQNRPIKGNTNWTQYEVVLDVPLLTEKIVYGLLLTGKGEAWIYNVKFDIVPNTVPVTNLMETKKAKPTINEQPTNLNFDK